MMNNPGAVIISIIVATAFSLLTFLLLGAPIFLGKSIPMNDNQLQLATFLMGGFLNAFGTVVTYWMGSSNGSRNKDMLLLQAPAPEKKP